MKKEKREEEMRQKFIDQSRKWDMIRAQMAEIRLQEEKRLEEKHRKQIWVIILTTKSLIKDQFFGKFNELLH